MKHSKKYAVINAAAYSKRPKPVSDTEPDRLNVDIIKADTSLDNRIALDSSQRRSGSTGTNPNPVTGPSKFTGNPLPSEKTIRGGLKVYTGAQEFRVVKSGLSLHSGGPKLYVAKPSAEGQMHVLQFRGRKSPGMRITAAREFSVKKGK